MISSCLTAGCWSTGVSTAQIPYAIVLFEPANPPRDEGTDEAARLEELSSHWGSYIYYDVVGKVRWRIQGPSGKLSPDGRKLLHLGGEGPVIRDLFTNNETVIYHPREGESVFDLRSAFSPDGRYAFFETGYTDFDQGPVLREVVRLDLSTGEEAGRCRLVDIHETTPEQGKFLNRIWNHDPGEITISDDGRYGFTLAWDPVSGDVESYLAPISYLEFPMGNFLYEGLFKIYRLDFETSDVTLMIGSEQGFIWIPPMFYDDATEMLYSVQRHLPMDDQYYQIMAIGPGGDALEILRSHETLHLMCLSREGEKLGYFAMTEDNTRLIRKSYGLLDLHTRQPEVFFELPVGLNEVAFGPDMTWFIYLSQSRLPWDELVSYFPPQGPRPYVHIIEIPGGRDDVLLSPDPPGKDLTAIIPLDGLP